MIVVERTVKPVFHQAEFFSRSDIFRQNCAVAKLEVVQLFDPSHGKCRSARKIPPSGKRPLDS